MVTCWAVNPEVPSSIPVRALEIPEILFEVFPAISDRVDDCISMVKGAKKLCIGAIHREN